MTHGMACPRCGQVVRVTQKGRLGEHRTAFYAVGQPRSGRSRERCVYSGGTVEDATNKITPLARRLLDKGLVKDASGNWVES